MVRQEKIVLTGKIIFNVIPVQAGGKRRLRSSNFTYKGIIMTEQNSAKTAATEAPAFKLQKLFIKDLSFENPNAPDVFLIQDAEPKVDLNLKLKNNKLDDEHWEVTIGIDATITDTKSKKTLFIIEIEQAGIFLLKNIPEQHLQMVLAVECPTLMFPYTRQIASQASVDGGFIPFLLEPVNFLAIFQNSQQQNTADQQTQ